RHYGQHNSVDAAPRFIECNLGVRSVTVNLKHPTGIRIIKELAAQSHGLLQNFRPKVLERLGLGDEALREINPKLVVVQLPGFGSSGPKSWYGTWGFNLTAFSGMTYLWNHPDQEKPVGSQGVYPDHVGFISGPTLMVAALLRSKLTGKGVTIDVAQVEATAYTLGVTYLDAAINNYDPQPRGNRDAVAAPHGCYRCLGDDRWCVISVRTDDEWKKFCAAIGRTELTADSRFADPRSRVKNASQIDAIVQEWTIKRSAEEVMRALQEDGIAAGVVQSGADLLADKQLRHRDYFARFSESPIGPFEIPRSALRFDGMSQEPLRLPSPLGADTEQILQEILGYDKDTIAKWRAEEVLT
ncbi:MAG TPA: CoA transferase, partial [Gammaproteobacteria bacterium]|nr:CoA transferase [Gammaproteobacteria bacterium]